MSKTYTVTLTDAQDKALAWAAADVQEWITNAATHRANVAMEEITQAEIQRKLAAGETISGTKEDIVLAADIKSAAERNAEMEASRSSMMDAQ